MADGEIVEALLAQHGIVLPPDEILELRACYSVVVAWSHLLDDLAGSVVESLYADSEIEK